MKVKGIISQLNVTGKITQSKIKGSITESGVSHEDEFITEWNLPAGSFTYPLYPGATYNFIINWGDGTDESTITSSGDPDNTHIYAEAGTYQISIRGSFSRQYINRSAISGYLTKIINWGDVGFTSMAYFACGCSNLTIIPNNAITGADAVESADSMFAECDLSNIPETIFDEMPLIEDFTNCFAVNISATGNAPDLWNDFPEATGDYCFNGDTNLTNYASIPADWK